MRLGVFARTFAGTDPHIVFSQVKSAGFSAAQYNLSCSGLVSLPETIPSEVADRVRSEAHRHGLRLEAVSGTFNMIHPDRSRRAAGLRRLETLAASCPAMGIDLITLCTGSRDRTDKWRYHPENDTPEAWRDLLISMERAISIAETCDVYLGIEPERANVVSGAAKARLLIDEMASDRLKIVMDAANLADRATGPEIARLVEEAVDLLSDRIAVAHAKDRTGDGAVVGLGEGVIDFRHYVATLRDAGFEGALIAHGITSSQAPAASALLHRVLQECGIDIDS
ncbi:MAG: sugar phosphate isomerase/epimerase family protein [Bacteroidota bacterium]